MFVPKKFKTGIYKNIYPNFCYVQNFSLKYGKIDLEMTNKNKLCPNANLGNKGNNILS